MTRRRCGSASPAEPPCRSRSCADSRTLRLHDPGGLRVVGDLPGRVVQPSGQERKVGSIGTPIEGVELQARRRRRARLGAGGETGEIVIRGHNVMKGYWHKPEETAAAISRRLVQHRRHRPGGRRRLLLHRRPQERPDHPGRLQRLPARGRGGAPRASGRRRGRRRSGCRTTRSARRSAPPWRSRPGETASPEELQAFVRERLAAYKYPRRVVAGRQPAQGTDRKDHAPPGGGPGGNEVTRPRRSHRRRPGGRRRRARPAADRRGARPLRRFRPDTSLPRLAGGAGRAARRLVGREAPGSAPSSAGSRSAVRESWPPAAATAGSPTRPGPTIRCCAACVQAYLATAAIGRGARRRRPPRLARRPAAPVPARQPDRRGRPEQQPDAQPGAWKAAIDTGGASLVRGCGQLGQGHGRAAPRSRRWSSRRPSRWARTWRSPPARVVYARRRCSSSSSTRRRPTRSDRCPLLIVPPVINKYYVIDLAPGRSLIEYLVARASRCSSCRGATPTPGIGTGASTPTAARSSRRSTRCGRSAAAAKASICRPVLGRHHRLDGGRLPGGAGGLDEVASLGLGVTVLDQSRAGPPARSSTSAMAARWPSPASAARGYLDGRSLAEVFAWLRPNDLIWNYWVNNYLQGRAAARVRRPVLERRHHPDGRRAAPRLHRPGPDQRADQAGRGDHARPAGRPVQGRRRLLRGRRRGRSPVPVAVVLPDHPAARRPVTFVLSNCGHIAALVNPPSNPKAAFQTAPSPYPAGSGRVSRLGADGGGQLVAATIRPGWPPAAAGRRRAGPARPEGLPDARRRARNLCPRPLRSAASRPAASCCGSR